MIEGITEPGKTVLWKNFFSFPAFSIAIDGYVKGPTRYNQVGPRLNLNHHEGVDRLSTRSTSGQMLMYIKQGLFKRFNEKGTPKAIIYRNDCDQDVSLTYWLAKNNERISHTKSEPLINRLVFAEDALDTTAGAYPLSLDSDLMRDVAWIFDPYTSVIRKVPSMNATEMDNVIDSIGARIDKYTLGKGEKLEPDARLEMLYSGVGWAMISETGFYARSKLLNSGTFAFITYRGESNGGHRYSLGKMSPFIDFPLQDLYKHYNEIEGISLEDTDKWGGGDTTGGSPRIRGSKMPAAQLASVTEQFIKNHRD